MIWLISLILALATALILVRPLLPAKSQSAKMMVSLFMLLFIGAAIGTYALIGAPTMSDPTRHKTAQMPDDIDIQGMVDGLAARLSDNPQNPEGWTRLIRSRIVLGDYDGLIRDHQQMRDVFAEQPEIIAKISEDSGFNALSEQILSPE